MKRSWAKLISIFFINLLAFSTCHAASFLFSGAFWKSNSFTFTQTSWAGGVTANLATRTSSPWTQYSAKDAAIMANTTISLISSSYAYTDDEIPSSTSSTPPTGGGFGSGTNSQTILTTGSIRLQNQP